MTGGSLYWILNHRIIGRSPLLGFTDAPGGRIWIRLEPRLISVRSQVWRAHQGWRYLADEDAPPDLDGHEDDIPKMPARLLRSEEHTSELQSLMRNSSAAFCLKKNK